MVEHIVERIKLTTELIRIVRNQIANGETNKEITESNMISYIFARYLANKIGEGLNDNEILK